MSATTESATSVVTYAWRGALAGIAGGVVFGVLMAMTGMLSMVAMLVGSESAGVGLVFGVITGSFADRFWPLLGAGALYGALWWVLGPLVLMPATGYAAVCDRPDRGDEPAGPPRLRPGDRGGAVLPQPPFRLRSGACGQ
ncbi:hypothetical protein ACFQZ2_12320 [Streptomonospora algeriensis]|uniref:Major facilitator superfamily (MFS) profile domain-containing protein n=1 Tax=Streptomonospora algeriensis TaxID=995084 RepID=A0ABW3BGR2_9ACTN